MISDHMTTGAKVYGLRIPVSDGAAMAWLHEHGEVLSTEVEEAGGEPRRSPGYLDAALCAVREARRGVGA
ncbi:MAG: hypothetical protein U5M50_00775 [Sphingobium sp.]|nr:hypothetical protein [Sphingobium sp.]